MGNAVKLVLVPIVALGCAVGLAGPAMAAKAASQVEITKATGDTEHVQVRGKVTSDRDSCKANRKVSVWHDVAPAGPSADDFNIGSTRTDDNGHWDLASVALPDKVYVVLKRTRLCKGDTSPTVVVKFT